LIRLRNFADWVFRRKWSFLAIGLMACAGYAADEWFFGGLVASKWIGLPAYESQMREALRESRAWGIAAIVMECAAVALAMPSWLKQRGDSDSSIILETVGSSRFGRAVLCTGYCLALSFVCALFLPAVGFLLAVVRGWK